MSISNRITHETALGSRLRSSAVIFRKHRRSTNSIITCTIFIWASSIRSEVVEGITIDKSNSGSNLPSSRPRRATGNGRYAARYSMIRKLMPLMLHCYECFYLARQWGDNSYRSLPLGRAKSINLKDILPATIDYQEFMARMRPIIVPLMVASGNRNNAY
jgi:hypothetical protein